MNYKKIVATILMLAVLVTAFATVSLPVSAADLSLRVISTAGLAGSNVVVEVKTTGRISNFSGNVTYDSSKLTLSAISGGDKLSEKVVQGNPKTRFLCAEISNTTFNNETLIKITFKIKSGATGKAMVGLEMESIYQLPDKADENGIFQPQPLSCSVTSGSVTVLPPATKIISEPTSLSVTKGQTALLRYTIIPANAGDVVAFSSADKSIATVNNAGLITGKGPGTVKITLKGKNVSATCTVTVYNYVSLRINNTKAIQNGVQTTVDDMGTKPFTLGGRTMIPFRFVGEKMGGKVNYVSESQPITLTYGNKKVEIKLNSKIMTVYTGSQKTTVTLDVAAQLKGGRTYIPLRAISQALGFTVYYDDATRIIIVNTPTMGKTLREERLKEAKAYIK